MVDINPVVEEGRALPVYTLWGISEVWVVVVVVVAVVVILTRRRLNFNYVLFGVPCWLVLPLLPPFPLTLGIYSFLYSNRDV